VPSSAICNITVECSNYLDEAICDDGRCKHIINSLFDRELKFHDYVQLAIIMYYRNSNGMLSFYLPQLNPVYHEVNTLYILYGLCIVVELASNLYLASQLYN